ncbi:MAG: tetratricopeptide repeat protein [Acidobacteriota bacterium]|nr:MAG: tetratricopeptide repeat protein [Acidobacteriota bacterium]
MTFNRIIVILLALGFLTVAALRLTRMSADRPPSLVDSAKGERIRHFWEVYREAGRQRAAGNIEAAIENYRRALDLKPDHEDSLYYSGNCHLELGRHREAITDYERLIEVNPLGSSRGWIQLGLIHASLEPGAPFDLDKARRYFERALEIDPDSGAMLGLGETALLAGRRREAREALKSNHADNAMSMASPFLLGYLSWREGRRGEAWRWFRLAVERGELKKPAVKWTEEGDVKADPELRWQALARQSVFGKFWLRARRYLKQPGFGPAEMEREYQSVDSVITAHSDAINRPGR